MKDKSLKILLGIIAVNLTLQTINKIDLFPTAHAQAMLPDGYSVTVASEDDGVWYKQADNLNQNAVYCYTYNGTPSCKVVDVDR